MFSDMSRSVDEDEHSIEMHLPYIRKIFDKSDIKIVPILVGSITKEQEAAYGQLLAPFFAREDTFTVISSDFCHWGTRFSYTFYYPSPPPATPIRLSRNGKIPESLTTFPIWQSITALDHEAMSLLSISGSSGPLSVHDDFAAYLSRTKNTICGRHPVGVLLGAIESFEGREITLRFVRYEQSSHCEDVKDSSVSYASAYVVF